MRLLDQVCILTVMIMAGTSITCAFSPPQCHVHDHLLLRNRKQIMANRPGTTTTFSTRLYYSTPSPPSPSNNPPALTAVQTLQSLLLSAAVATDPSSSSIGTSLLTQAPLLLAPVASLVAGQQALKRRKGLESDVTVSEQNLKALRQQVNQNEAAITASFGAAALSSAVSLGVLLGAFDTPMTNNAAENMVVQQPKQEQRASKNAPTASKDTSSTVTPSSTISKKETATPPTIKIEDVAPIAKKATMMRGDGKIAPSSPTPSPDTSSAYDSLMTKLLENSASKPQKQPDVLVAPVVPGNVMKSSSSQTGALVPKLQESSTPKEQDSPTAPAGAAAEVAKAPTSFMETLMTKIDDMNSNEDATEKSSATDTPATTAIAAKKEAETDEFGSPIQVAPPASIVAPAITIEQKEAPPIAPVAKETPVAPEKKDQEDSTKPAAPALSIREQKETDEFGNPVETLPLTSTQKASTVTEKKEALATQEAPVSVKKDLADTTKPLVPPTNILATKETDEFGNPVPQPFSPASTPTASTIVEKTELPATKEASDPVKKDPGESAKSVAPPTNILAAKETDEFGNPVPQPVSPASTPTGTVAEKKEDPLKDSVIAPTYKTQEEGTKVVPPASDLLSKKDDLPAPVKKEENVVDLSKEEKKEVTATKTDAVVGSKPASPLAGLRSSWFPEQDESMNGDAKSAVPNNVAGSSTQVASAPTVSAAVASLVSQGATVDVVVGGVGVAALGVFAALVAAGGEDDEKNDNISPVTPKTSDLETKPSSAKLDSNSVTPVKSFGSTQPPSTSTQPPPSRPLRQESRTPDSYMDRLAGSQPAKVKESSIKKVDPSQIKQSSGYLSGLNGGKAPEMSIQTSTAPPKPAPETTPAVEAKSAVPSVPQNGTPESSSGSSYLDRVSKSVALSSEPPLTSSSQPPARNGNGNFGEIKAEQSASVPGAKKPSYSAFGAKPRAPTKTFGGGSYLEKLAGGSEPTSKVGSDNFSLPSIDELDEQRKRS